MKKLVFLLTFLLVAPNFGLSQSLEENTDFNVMLGAVEVSDTALNSELDTPYDDSTETEKESALAPAVSDILLGGFEAAGGIVQTLFGAGIIAGGVPALAPTLGASTLAVLGGGYITIGGINSTIKGSSRFARGINNLFNYYRGVAPEEYEIVNPIAYMGESLGVNKETSEKISDLVDITSGLPTPSNLAKLGKLRPLIDTFGNVLNIRRGANGILLVDAVDEIASSKKLGENLLKKLGSRPSGHHAHHIVAGGRNRESAIQSREILKRFGIGINEAENGIYLPADVHRSLHTNAYYDNVNKALSKAKDRDEAIAILEKIADQLSKGTFPK